MMYFIPCTSKNYNNKVIFVDCNLILEANLLSNDIDVTDSLPQSITHETFNSFGHISVAVDRFGRYFRFCHNEFDEKAISGGFMALLVLLVGGGGGSLSDFRELCFCGTCGPC